MALWMFYLTACFFALLKTGRSGIAFSASILYLMLLFVSIIVDVCLIGGRLA
jgi:hypothetical protein